MGKKFTILILLLFISTGYFAIKKRGVTVSPVSEAEIGKQNDSTSLPLASNRGIASPDQGAGNPAAESVKPPESNSPAVTLEPTTNHSAGRLADQGADLSATRDSAKNPDQNTHQHTVQHIGQGTGHNQDQDTAPTQQSVLNGANADLDQANLGTGLQAVAPPTAALVAAPKINPAENKKTAPPLKTTFIPSSALFVAPIFSFSRIDSSDFVNGGHATLGSQLNYGVELGWAQFWSEKVETSMSMNAKSETYSSSVSAFTLTNSNIIVGGLQIEMKNGAAQSFRVVEI